MLIAAGVAERAYGLSASAKLHPGDAYRLVAGGVDRERILKAASAYLALPVETITAYVSERNPDVGCTIIFPRRIISGLIRRIRMVRISIAMERVIPITSTGIARR